MIIHFPDRVSPALTLARQALEACHAPDSFDCVGQIEESLPREGYRLRLSPMENGKQTLCLSGGSAPGTPGPYRFSLPDIFLITGSIISHS